MTYRTITTLAPTVVAAALIGCGAAGPSQELVTARYTVEQAKQSEAARYAPDQLHRAERTLERAESVHRDEPGSGFERDLAYVADRQARIAMTRARQEVLREEREEAEREYRRRLEAANRAREQQLDDLDRQLAQVSYDLEIVRADLAQREDQLGERAQELRAREQALVEQQRRLERERAARARAELQARQALEELAEVREEQDRMIITLSGSVLFAHGQSDLLPSARRRLQSVATVLAADPDRQMVVEGHTDSTGSVELNDRLSQDRADAVREYLIAQGVPAENVQAVGRGEQEPVATNDTVEGRANNRRVEIIVEPEAQAK